MSWKEPHMCVWPHVIINSYVRLANLYVRLANLYDHVANLYVRLTGEVDQLICEVLTGR